MANKRSIAWAIAKAWAAAGARLIFNYQGERLKEKRRGTGQRIWRKNTILSLRRLERRRDRDLFENVRGETDRLDLLLHSLAFAPKEALEGDFLSTTREAFRTAHDISAYSLVALAARSRAADDRRRQHCGDDLLRFGKRSCRTTMSWA